MVCRRVYTACACGDSGGMSHTVYPGLAQVRQRLSLKVPFCRAYSESSGPGRGCFPAARHESFFFHASMLKSWIKSMSREEMVTVTKE